MASTSTSRRASRRRSLKADPDERNLPAQLSTWTMAWYAPLLNFSGCADDARGFVQNLRGEFLVAATPFGEAPPFFVDQLLTYPRADGRALNAAFQTSSDAPKFGIVQGSGDVLAPVADAAWAIGRTCHATDGLPEAWAARANSLDEIWVPSGFHAEALARSGVSVPIYVVPGGVDHRRFRPGLAPLTFDHRRHSMFLGVGAWTAAHGWDLLLTAWTRAFSSQDDVCLLVRSSLPPGHRGRSVDRQIDQFLETQLKLKRADIAPIIVLADPLSEAELPRLYASASALVAPVRGTSWGRAPLQALACGTPVIATNWGAGLEYLSAANSQLVDVERLELVGSDQPERFQGQRWALPSVEHLTECLRLAVDSPEPQRQRAAQGRRDVVERWGWTTTARSAAARLTQRIDERRPFWGGTTVRARGASARPFVVRWVGDFYSHHSLAGLNRNFSLDLVQRGFDVRAYTSELGPVPADIEPVLSALRVNHRRPGGDVDVEVRHQWPPDLQAPSHRGAWVQYQPWEFGAIPSDWVSPLQDEADEVWCLTSWVKKCFIDSGVAESKVHVVPPRIDTERFHPEGQRYPLKTRKAFRFLFVGGTIPRKGVDILLWEFGQRFTKRDDVCLVVKPFGAGGVYQGSNIDRALRMAAADPVMPEIEVVQEEMSGDEMAQLYRSCDVLVQPYRGEGFGLPIAEAMACGLPVIVTGYGAAMDFCDETNAFLLPAVLRETFLPGLAPPAGRYWLAEPDSAELGRLLVNVVGAETERQARGRAGRLRITQQFGAAQTDEIAASRLAALGAVEAVRFRN